MNVFDEDGYIQKLNKADYIADLHLSTRIELYHDIKEFLEYMKEYHAIFVRNKANFIE